MTRSRDTADQINRINSSAANATAITVDSSENVTLTGALEVTGTVTAAGGKFLTERGTAAAPVYSFSDDTDTGMFNISNADLGFSVGGTTRMTLDASGNLMTVKTAVDTDAVGSELRSNGLVSSTRTGAEALFLNRKSSNGSIAVFAKDGSTVGSIGTSSGGRLTVGSGSSAAGIRFDGAQWIPTISDAASDNGVDIGWSDSRIRNVYLSGGVYLGGTGAANKISDYETGSFTPIWDGYTPYGTSGRYTKIGNTVTVHAELVTNSTADYSGVQINNLPFTAVSTPCGGGMTWTDGVGPYAVPLMTRVTPSTTQCTIQCVQSGAVTGLNYVGGSIDIGGFGTFRWTIVYQTSA